MSETDGQQIAYGAAMDAFPSWVSLEESLGIRVSGWRVNRGRQDETQRTGTGTASIFVNDMSGYLGSGAEFPNHARLSLRGSPRFRGFVDEIDAEVAHNVIAQDGAPAGLTRVSIECVDLFDYLSTVELVPGTDGDDAPPGMEQYVYFDTSQVDDRMIDVLNQSLVPEELQNLFSGNVELMPKGYQAGTTAMQILDECADAEWPGVSNRFINSEGKYAFRGRHARFSPENPTYGIQFWEAGTGAQVTSGRAQIRRLGFNTSRKLINNEAMAYPEGMAESDFPLVLIEDAASRSQWGRKSWAAENLLTQRHLSNGNSGADESVLFAAYQVANYKDPVARVNRVQFMSLHDSDPRAAATWALMCGIEIGDVLDLYTDWISGRYFVEGFTLDVKELDGTIPFAVMVLDLSPAAFWESDPF